MSGGNEPRRPPGWNALAACALTVTLMALVEIGPAGPAFTVAPGPVAVASY